MTDKDRDSQPESQEDKESNPERKSPYESVQKSVDEALTQIKISYDNKSCDTPSRNQNENPRNEGPSRTEEQPQNDTSRKDEGNSMENSELENLDTSKKYEENSEAESTKMAEEKRMKLDENSTSKEQPNPYDNFLELLDSIEGQVEGYRKRALALMDEKESLSESLKTIAKVCQDDKSMSEVDKEELRVNLERIERRLDGVRVKLVTIRTEEQNKARDEMETFLGKLVFHIESGDEKARKDEKTNIGRYLNSCWTRSDSENVFAKYPPDEKFEKKLLTLCSEDQRLTKSKLFDLWNHLEATEAALNQGESVETNA